MVDQLSYSGKSLYSNAKIWQSIRVGLISLTLIVPTVIVLIIFCIFTLFYGSVIENLRKKERDYYLKSLEGVMDKELRAKMLYHNIRNICLIVLSIPYILSNMFCRKYFTKVKEWAKKINTSSYKQSI